MRDLLIDALIFLGVAAAFIAIYLVVGIVLDTW